MLGLSRNSNLQIKKAIENNDEEKALETMKELKQE